MHLDIAIAIIGTIICCCATAYLEIQSNNDEIKAIRDKILEHSQGE